MARQHPCVGSFFTGCNERVVQRCCDVHRVLRLEVGKIRVCTSIVNKSPHRLKRYNFESGGEGWSIKYYNLLPLEIPQTLFLVVFADEQSAAEASVRAQPQGSLFLAQQDANVAALIKFSEDQTSILLRYCNQCHDYNPRAGCCTNGRTCQRRKPRQENLEEFEGGGGGAKKRKQNRNELSPTSPQQGGLSPQSDSSHGSGNSGASSYHSSSSSSPPPPSNYEGQRRPKMFPPMVGMEAGEMVDLGDGVNIGVHVGYFPPPTELISAPNYDFDHDLPGEFEDFPLFGVDANAPSWLATPDLNRPGTSPDHMPQDVSALFYPPSNSPADPLQFAPSNPPSDPLQFVGDDYKDELNFPGVSGDFAVDPGSFPETPELLYARELPDSEPFYLDQNLFEEPMLISVPTWEHTREFIEHQMKENPGERKNGVKEKDEVTTKLASLKSQNARQLQQNARKQEQEKGANVANLKQVRTEAAVSVSALLSNERENVLNVQQSSSRDSQTASKILSSSVTVKNPAASRTPPPPPPQQNACVDKTERSNSKTNNTSDSNKNNSNSSSNNNINSNKKHVDENENGDVVETEDGEGAILNVNTPPAVAIFVSDSLEHAQAAPAAAVLVSPSSQVSPIPFATPIWNPATSTPRYITVNITSATPLPLPSIGTTSLHTAIINNNNNNNNVPLASPASPSPPASSYFTSSAPAEPSQRRCSLSQSVISTDEKGSLLPTLYLHTAVFWWVFGGFLGAHHFYLRRRGWALLYMCTLGFFGLGWLMDLFRLCALVEESNRRTDSGTVHGPIVTYKQEEAYLFWLPPFGILGMHHFYLRRYHLGVLYMFTFGLLGMGWIVDGWRLSKLVSRANVFDRLMVEHKASGGNPTKCPNPWMEKDVGLATALWLPPWGLLGCHLYYLGLCQRALLYTFTLALGGYGWFNDRSHLERLTRERNKILEAGSVEPALRMV